MKKIIVIIVLLTITFSIYGEQYATPINKLYGRRCTFEYRIGHENNCCFILIRAGRESPWYIVNFGQGRGGIPNLQNKDTLSSSETDRT